MLEIRAAMSDSSARCMGLRDGSSRSDVRARARVMILRQPAIMSRPGRGRLIATPRCFAHVRTPDGVVHRSLNRKMVAKHLNADQSEP